MSSVKKRPWIKWYPSDWRSEPSLRLCSRSARSLWLDLLGLMHESERYGYLIVNGSPPDHRQIATYLGDDPRSIKVWMEELKRNNVLSIDAEGLIYSRRMVRDYERSEEGRRAKLLGLGIDPDTGEPIANKPDSHPSRGEGLKPSTTRASPPSRSASTTISHKPEAISQKQQQLPENFDWVNLLEDACRSAGINPGRAVNELGTAKTWASLGLPPSAITRIIEQVAARPGYSPPRSLGYFTRMLQDAAALLPPAAEEAATDQIAINRDAAVAHFRKLGPVCWPDRFGPKPDEPGCLASPEALARHGYKPRDAA